MSSLKTFVLIICVEVNVRKVKLECHEMFFQRTYFNSIHTYLDYHMILKLSNFINVELRVISFIKLLIIS